MTRRYVELVPERPALPNLERWYGELAKRPPFIEHCGGIPLLDMSKEGRLLGLIGGLGPGATVHYYRGLIAAHAAQGRVARMLVAHADVDRARPLAEANALDELARYLNGFIDQTAAGGAEMAAIVAITPHICAAQLLPLLRIPLIDMVSVVGDAIRARGLKRVALFGTRSTVASRMFGRLDVDVVMPQPDEIDFIHNAYLDVVYDRSTPAGSTGCARLRTR